MVGIYEALPISTPDDLDAELLSGSLETISDNLAGSIGPSDFPIHDGSEVHSMAVEVPGVHRLTLSLSYVDSLLLDSPLAFDDNEIVLGELEGQVTDLTEIGMNTLHIPEGALGPNKVFHL